LQGQDDIKAVIADSVEIIDYVQKADNLKFGEGSNLGLSMTSTLDNQGFAALRTGGPSLISTLLHRGMASRHIAVLWGGFNIQSVVNGTFDLSLIRNTFDRTKFYQNGTTAITGNASIAGAISLGNNVIAHNSTSINLSLTSSKNRNFTVLNKLKYKNYHHHFAVNLTSDENQYSYLIFGRKVTQKMAKFSMWDINYEGNYIVSDKISLTGGAWLQEAERNIPPTKTSVNIIQEQEDSNYRGFLHLDYYLSNASKFSIRNAYFNESLDYQAPGISSLATTKVHNIAIDFMHSSGLSLSGQYRRDKVQASFFVPDHLRNSIAFSGNYNTEFKSLGLGVSVRQEWVDSKLQPFVLGLRFKTEIVNDLTSTLSYNKGYTLPSFNDLYWPTGGNPDLKTERSHEFDLGFDLEYGKQKSKSVNLNIFFNLIDDWIQWALFDGIFQPVNQRKVRNLGFEIKLIEEIQLNGVSLLKVHLLYGFTDSRLIKHYFNTDNEGKKAIFIPAHKITGQISFIRQSWHFHLRPQYYSKRYDTLDNSNFVSGYFIADLEVNKRFQFKKKELNLSLAIENGLNNDYENISFYPMPLRVFRLGINFKF